VEGDIAGQDSAMLGEPTSAHHHLASIVTSGLYGHPIGCADRPDLIALASIDHTRPKLLK
jgi:hypothetical protein